MEGGTQHEHRVLRERGFDHGHVDTPQDLTAWTTNLGSRSREPVSPNGGIYSQLTQRRHGVRREAERESHGSRLWRLLEDPDLPSRPAERNPGGQSPDTGAGDEGDA